MNRAKLLVDIILDKSADSAEREDALMDVYEYTDDFIEDALVKVINDEGEDYFLRSDATDSLLYYWNTKHKYDLEKFKNLPLRYRNSILEMLKDSKDEWLKNFEKANQDRMNSED